MKVLHVLYQSFPHITGSSTRSRDLLMAQKELKIKPVVITSPFQEGVKNIDVLYGIKHYRTFNPETDIPTSETDKGFRNRLKRIMRMPYFIRKIRQVVKIEKPDVIHAHATFFCGLSATFVGLIYKLPVIYEVRSLWEQRILEQNKSLKSKIQVNFISLLETWTMRFANHVVTINNHLKTEIVRRGIKDSKVTIVGNAVNFEMIDNEIDLIVSNCSKEPSEFVFGYVGGISAIEGLDILIKTFAKLKNNGYTNILMIYGDGVFMDELKQLKTALKVDNVYFKGKIAPELISTAYDSIDIIVNPRRNLHINNTVTPLKPLEAMAYGKVVLGSNVGGLREIIKNGENGLLFNADDEADLYRKIIQIIESSPNSFQELKTNAIEYVLKERNWLLNGRKYVELYEMLTP